MTAKDIESTIKNRPYKEKSTQVKSYTINT